ncbi:oxygenase MpaB family protein [Amycolatopsis sp. WGS_07]
MTSLKRSQVGSSQLPGSGAHADRPEFGDSSAIRKVACESLLILGCGRATILQNAHPGIAQGTAAHSGFARNPLRRLHHTMIYLYGVVFGTREEAAGVSRTVVALHRKVAGPGYSADDPALQVWVAATMYDTAITLYEGAFGPLPPAEADECYQQYSVLATAIGCPREAWPASRRDFASYWQSMIATMRIDDTSREIAEALLCPSRLPVAWRIALPCTVSSPSGCCRNRSGTASAIRGRQERPGSSGTGSGSSRCATRGCPGRSGTRR